MLAKRRAKAMKLRLPPSIAGKSLAKGTRKRAKAPVPPPTLAATHARRAAADVGYIAQPDGYHIKRVVHRVTPGPAPPVPYLPGEEGRFYSHVKYNYLTHFTLDIPHSDAESDNSDATVLELTNLSHLGQLDTTFDVAAEAGKTLIEPNGDLVDYDAEGEDEDEDEDVYMQDFPMANYQFSAPAAAHVGTFGSTTSTEAAPHTYCIYLLTIAYLTQPTNPFINASDDDIQALFGGLDNLHFGNSPTITNNNNFPHPIPDHLVTHAQYLFGNITNESQYTAQGSNELEPFATVDNLQAGTSNLVPVDHSTGPLPSHPAPLPLVNNPPPPSRVATPAPWIVVPEPQAPIPPRPVTPPRWSQSVPPPPAHNATWYMLASHASAPIGSPFSLHAPTSTRPRPHLSTRELVSHAHAEAWSPCLPIPPPFTYPTNANNPRTRSPLDHDNSHPSGITALRRSLNSPDFLDNSGYNTDDVISEGEEQCLDPDAPQPPTPVALEDTDIGLNEYSPVQITQARCRASRFLNVRRLVPLHNSPRHIPTVLELRTNSRKLFNLSRRRHRGRYSEVAPETSRCNCSVLCSGALTPDQQSVASLMEFSLLKDVVCDNPWPEDRDAYLQAAQQYATNMTGISSADVYTHRFLHTIFYRTSGNRGNSLSRIEVMMEQEFSVTMANKTELYQLMNKDLFLYPTADHDPSQHFHVGALGVALEIIFFKSAKTLGLAFMEELCQLDDAEKCAHWHRKLRDQTAHKGVSPGAIAFAATQMYWALEKMYLGTNIHFDEGHFRGRWDSYFHALIKLPHLGQLRVDLLDRLKEYYMDHWPSDEQDDDNNSFPVW
ncbi:hypothetical protein FRC10_006457 [Ceratobasidium sp. 414]|nr:hypothetical protein FRC10_006457 [Ceratobasidium sp. 414]